MVAITAEKFALQADKERLQAALAGLTQQLQQLQSDAKLTESLNRKEKQERRALEAELWSLAQELKGTDRTHHQQREELQQRAGRQKEALEAELEEVAKQRDMAKEHAADAKRKLFLEEDKSRSLQRDLSLQRDQLVAHLQSAAARLEHGGSGIQGVDPPRMNADGSENVSRLGAGGAPSSSMSAFASRSKDAGAAPMEVPKVVYPHDNRFRVSGDVVAARRGAEEPRAWNERDDSPLPTPPDTSLPPQAAAKIGAEAPGHGAGVDLHERTDSKHASHHKAKGERHSHKAKSDHQRK